MMSCPFVGQLIGIILAQKLIQDNRQEDLRHAAEDSDFKKKLLEEYALEA